MKLDFAREIALKAIYEIDVEQAYSNIVLDKYLDKYRERLNIKDINLISEIVYGVITWKLTIDTIIQKYSNTKLNKISKWVLNILRIGTYQILFLDKIPKSAAVNECVNLTKKYGFKSASFVNAVLRKIEKSDYDELNKIENDIERISKLNSIPMWIVEELLKQYDIEVVQEICKYSNERPQLTIRINTLKSTKAEIIEKLKEKNIEYQESKIEDFLHLKNVKNISELDLFKEGLITVQDEGAGKIGKVLSAKEGNKVLDACSAPGGKTTHIAQLMNNRGTIIAWDLHKHRLQLVEENAKRLGISIIQTEQRDATKFQEKLIDSFDKILLDVPCLGIGVIKRKPDIKWQRKKEDIDEITKIQLKILKNCSKYLKIGGELVYSTCSILKNENEDIIEKFIKEVTDETCRKTEKFEKIYEEIILPNKLTDGFYIAKIKRIY